MPDEKNRDNLPEEPEIDGEEMHDAATEEKPRADDDDIHKVPTLDLDYVEDEEDDGDVIEGEYEEETIPRETTEDIDALHASDPPLERGAPEDDSMVMRAGLSRTDTAESDDGGEAMDATVPHYAAELDGNYDDDEDVPFHLPRSEDLGGDDDDDSPIGSKLVTMPHEVPPGDAVTLPGTDGLDPNPDFSADVTMPHPTAPPQPQREAQPYQRPREQAAPQPARKAQKGIPPAPQAAKANNKQKPLPKRRSKRRNIGCLAIFLGVLVTFCGGLTLISVVVGGFAYARVGDLLNERIEEVDRYSSFQSTFLYDRNGRQLYEVFNEGRRTNVDLDEMPQALIDATIAIEDDSFYRNIGIDIPATSVALMRYLGADPGQQTEGGSTITQQLVRNVLFDPAYRAERSVKRKAEEILLAIALTGRKGKNEILELYLNEIYYGNLAYGVQAAAQVFFGKDVSELTLGEAALLAGLPQAPAELDPLNSDPTIQAAVQARWRQVLDEMVEERFITVSERDAALREGLQFEPRNVSLRAPHFTVYAQGELERLMREMGYSAEEITRGGLHVYTTVDLDINERAQQIAAQQIAQMVRNNASNAAVTVLKPLTGEILAMVGSIDYENEAIDGHVNVTIALRQPGSAMKPFMYSAALERGMTTADVIWDTPTRIGIPGQQPYVPRNYDGTFHGPMRMRRALANSYNIPAVQTLRQNVGVDYLLALMQRVGVESLGTDASRYGLSLTLGGGEVSLLELTNAYAVFPNQGSLVGPTSILCILDNDDNIIYQYENGCPRGSITPETVARTGLGTQVLDPRIAFVISDILSDNRARSEAMGPNSALNTPSIATSVKTGTTDDFKDNWTVGYTRNVAVGVWVGNNNGDPMVNTSGLSGAAPIWNQVMTEIYNNQNWLNEFAVDGQLQTDQLQPPPGVSLRTLCNVRSLQDPAPSCPATMTEWMLDSPAGLPDGQGGLEYPPARSQQPDAVPSSGSYVQLVEPGIYRTAVFPLPEAVANAIQFNVAPGEETPPPPKYCRVPVELLSTPGAQEQLFIAPPPVQADAARAEQWARQRGLAFLPTIDCTQELMVAGPVGPNIVTAFISSPQPNQSVNGPIPVTGTAQFTQQQALYYKLEIVGGQWSSWTTIEDVKHSPVVNGQLGTLPALPSGSYRLRLVIVGLDANHLQTPYEVPFNVP